MGRKQLRIATFFVVSALAAVILFFALPKLIVLVLPFLLAYLIAQIINPIVVILNKKLKVPNKIASAIVVTITVLCLVWVFTILIYGIVNEISNLVAQKDLIAQKISSVYYNWYDFVERYFGSDAALFIKENIKVKDIVSNITGYLAGYIMPTIENAFDMAKQLPNILIFTIVLVMGTYFMSSDKENISKNLRKLIPGGAKSTLSEFKKDMSLALVGYIRAQLILMTITFFELTVGFTIIGGEVASYALLLGICIAIIDALPILGAGAILIPWGLYSLAAGNVRVGVSLLILYGICMLVRQILEPRIVGKQIGLHPLLTLMAMYAGLRIFGILGMILGPVTALVIKNLADEGLILKFWRYICYGKASCVSEDK
jgi:sporulation integral membrane protein YtvI